jgi:hypothetical protein
MNLELRNKMKNRQGERLPAEPSLRNGVPMEGGEVPWQAGALRSFHKN